MTLLRTLGRLAAVLMLFAAMPAAAAKPGRLTAQDMNDIGRAEAYLNSITTLSARFIQVSPSGVAAEGTAYLQRPGFMRLDYDPPNHIQLLADGRFLIYYDKQLDQTSYIGLNDTPAGILVRPQVRLEGGDVTVTGVARGPGMVAVSLIQATDPGAGEITLVFQERPFELKQWRVRDPQGQVTTVSLFGAQTGIRLDPNLFHFVDPQARPRFKE